MANTDTANAKQYATLAQVAAAQAKIYAQSGTDATQAAEEAKNAANDASAYSVNALSAAEIALSQATSASSSAVSAANSAVEASSAVVDAVKQQITFTSGGILYSALDRISDGTYLYYWTGVFPVTIPPDSSVSGTGGIGVGFWAVDNDLLLRTSLDTPESGNGAEIVRVVPYNDFYASRNVNQKLGDIACIFDFDSDSANDDTLRFKKSVLAGLKRVYVPSKYGALYVGELDFTAPMFIEGDSAISIDETPTRIYKKSGAAYGIQFLGDINNRPHGGGLRNIDLRGQLSSDTGILLKVKNWSYFFGEMLGLQNNADWGASFQNVAESGLFTFLCRRLGSETSGCIRFEDYITIPNNNVNNFRLQNGTMGLNSGTWIYGTDNSNLDVVWIENNKIEFDSTPISPNTTNKSVIYLGQANKVFIDKNTFTNFKLSNPNLYVDCIKIGANSRISPVITDNGFDGCDTTLINIAGGAVKGRGNFSNQAGATGAGALVCTSNLPQDIDPIIFHSSNGNKNKRSYYDAASFVSSHKMYGTVNNPFVVDADSMTQYGTVISCPSSTEIRRFTISKALISSMSFVHISARVKNASGSATAVSVVVDGTTLSSISVTSDSTWKVITWQIKPSLISNGMVIINNGLSPILFDGVFVERKDYFDWSFAWTPGAIAANSSVTSPTQSVSDTTGFAASYVKADANNTVSGLILQASLATSGNVTVQCFNPTASPITPSFTRVKLRYYSSGTIE